MFNRVLSLSGDEVEETEVAGFSSDQQTLWCGNVVHGQLVQVTKKAVHLVNSATRQQVAEWKPPTDKNISVVAANSLQIVCATGPDIYYIEILENELIKKG